MDVSNLMNVKKEFLEMSYSKFKCGTSKRVVAVPYQMLQTLIVLLLSL